MGSPVRRQVCDGCWRGCRYRDFRDSVPVPRPDRRGDGRRRSPSQRRDFLQVAADKANEVTRNIGDGVGDRLTKSKILGKMHEEKRESWLKATEECFYRGEKLPETTEEALRWVASLGAERFRKEVQGWTHDQWVRKGRGYREVTVEAFLRWWDEARQRRLEDDLDRPNLIAPGVGAGEEDPWMT